MDPDHERLHTRITDLEGRFQKIEVMLASEFATLNASIKTLVLMAESYVTKERFQIVQILVYGFAAIILTGVIGALIAKVIVK